MTVPIPDIERHNVLHDFDDLSTMLQHTSRNLSIEGSHVLVAIYPSPGLVIDAYISFDDAPTIDNYAETFKVMSNKI